MRPTSPISSRSAARSASPAYRDQQPIGTHRSDNSDWQTFLATVDPDYILMESPELLFSPPKPGLALAYLMHPQPKRFFRGARPGLTPHPVARRPSTTTMVAGASSLLRSFREHNRLFGVDDISERDYQETEATPVNSAALYVQSAPQHSRPSTCDSTSSTRYEPLSRSDSQASMASSYASTLTSMSDTPLSDNIDKLDEESDDSTD
jgi:hypothetical protein